MWYVIQTSGGEEEKTADMIRNLVSKDLVRECFTPKRVRLKKFYGNWNKVEEILFHGYTFVVTEKPEELYEKLRRIPKLTKVLGRDGDYFLPLGEEEEQLVRGIGDEDHRTSLSGIAIEEGKQFQVLYGPLKGYEGDIVKVNLHKREAVVKVKFMGRELELKLGIEMVEARDLERLDKTKKAEGENTPFR